mgnify:CR=1 FL=1
MNNRLRVLVIEDDEAYVAMLREFLEPSLDIRRVSTLREGLAESRTWSPAIVLLDLRLPDSSGVDTLIRFRREGPDIPVVAISAYMDDDMVAGCLQAGAAHALDKELLMPGSSDLLVWLLRTADLCERAKRTSTLDPVLPAHVSEIIARSASMVMDLQRRLT